MSVVESLGVYRSRRGRKSAPFCFPISVCARQNKFLDSAPDKGWLARRGFL